MKAALIILLLAGSAMAYDPMDTIQPENATEQVVDSIVLGLHNAAPYLIPISILGFFAVAFTAIAALIYLMNRSQGGT